MISARESGFPLIIRVTATLSSVKANVRSKNSLELLLIAQPVGNYRNDGGEPPARDSSHHYAPDNPRNLIKQERNRRAVLTHGKNVQFRCATRTKPKNAPKRAEEEMPRRRTERNYRFVVPLCAVA